MIDERDDHEEPTTDPDAPEAEETDEAVADGVEGEAASKKADAELSMDELMAQYGAAEPLQELREGDVVVGTVVHIDEHGAMVDVGTKAEGVIARSELDDIHEQLAVGDEVEVYVTRIEDEDGHLLLSKRQADYERAWEDIVQKMEDGEILDCPVVEAVKGGLLVDLGIYGQGFVPASHVSTRRPRNLQRYVGQDLRVKVIEVERKRRRVVLSHRKVVEEERASERDETLRTLKEGQVRRGVVRRITDFGAFVDIGGVDGLLHISEISWRRIDSPHEELKVGEDVDVMVLKLNLEEGRISLGRRQLLPDPWREVPKLYREGQVVRATVRKLTERGAIVRLPVGIDGFVDVPEALRVDGAEPAEAADSPAADADGSAEVSQQEAVETAPESEAAEAPEAVDEAAEELEAPEAVDEAAEAELEAPEAVDEAAEEEPEAPEAVDEAAEEEPEAPEAVDEAAEEPEEPVEEAAEAEAPVAEGDVSEEGAGAEAMAEPEGDEGDEGDEDDEGEAEESAAEESAAAERITEGCEVEVQIDRIALPDREMELSLASVRAGEPTADESHEARRPRPSAPSGELPARGRYSDRAREESRPDDRERRRDRRRGREQQRERRPEQPEPMPLEHAPPPPARRTLGDLMGDKLRSLLQDQAAEPEDEEAPRGPDAEEGSKETSN